MSVGVGGCAGVDYRRFRNKLENMGLIGVRGANVTFLTLNHLLHKVKDSPSPRTFKIPRTAQLLAPFLNI